MRILISSLVLDRSGTPTYTLTLYRELIRRGHEVVVYSPQLGALAGAMKATPTLDSVEKPDVILAQMNVCAEEMREKFPDTHMIFMSHGIEPETEQPPRCEVQWFTAINEDVMDNLVSRGVDPKRITIVRDFIDTDLFRPLHILGNRLGSVLYISNYKKWLTYRVVRDACNKLDVELRCVGAPYGRSRHMEQDINWADLVISSGRALLEGMSCGRPVISFERMKGDGYITPSVYLESRTRNFGGDKCLHSFDADALGNEMLKYHPLDGKINRTLVQESHDHIRGVGRILELANEVIHRPTRQ